MATVVTSAVSITTECAANTTVVWRRERDNAEPADNGANRHGRRWYNGYAVVERLAAMSTVAVRRPVTVLRRDVALRRTNGQEMAVVMAIILITSTITVIQPRKTAYQELRAT